MAIFKLLEKELLKCEMEGVFELLSNFQKDVDPDELIKAALSFTFPGSLVDKLEKDFLDNPDKEISRICRNE